MYYIGRCAKTPKRVSSSSPSASPAISRALNFDSTEKSKPASSNTNPSAAFQSMRPLTASAACLSVRFSANCKTVTNASRQGASAGVPRREKRSANVPSS